MKNLIIIAIIVSIFLTSCAVDSKINTSKTLDIYGAGVIQKPIIVDLNVKGTKDTGIVNGSYGSEIEPLKQLAVADLLKKANGDVLIEPKFEIESTGDGQKVIVTGWSATYTNFRPITKEDVELLKVGVVQKADVFETKTATKKKSPIGPILGLLMGAMGMVLISLNLQ